MQLIYIIILINEHNFTLGERNPLTSKYAGNMFYCIGINYISRDLAEHRA